MTREPASAGAVVKWGGGGAFGPAHCQLGGGSGRLHQQDTSCCHKLPDYCSDDGTLWKLMRTGGTFNLAIYLVMNHVFFFTYDQESFLGLISGYKLEIQTTRCQTNL